jgi:hypothetical protein
VFARMNERIRYVAGFEGVGHGSDVGAEREVGRWQCGWGFEQRAPQHAIEKGHGWHRNGDTLFEQHFSSMRMKFGRGSQGCVVTKPL